MIDWRSHLEDGDPLIREGELAPADAMRMRQTVLSTMPAVRAGLEWRVLPVAATLVLACVGAAWFVRVSAPEPVRVRAELPHQQLQFLAPNGTRIIWTFNPDLEVR